MARQIAASHGAPGGTVRRDTPVNRTPGEEMSDHQIVGFLGRKIFQSMNDEDGDLSDVRQENLNLYLGKEGTVPSREGYSKFDTREVLETVEWVLPSVLRVFTSGDRIVVFDPVSEDDEKTSEQETDITNHEILKSNKGKGFLALHDWFKDALMYPNGYLKVYMEEAIKTDVGRVTTDEIGLQMLVDDEDVEILEQDSHTEIVELDLPDPQTGQMTPQEVEVEIFDLRVRTTKKIMELRLLPVPPEECLVDNDLTSLDLDEADFVCHRVRKTFTQLVLEGIDKDELEEVGGGEDYQWNDERTNRLFYEDEDPDASDEDDPSMRTYWVHECYVWFDYDGDGIGEFRKVVLIGDHIFENEEVNYQPMIALASILMAHKHTGLSYADITKDLQLLMTTLTRQLLDNTYKVNIGKKLISEDSLTEDGMTMEAMLDTSAEYIPVRGNAQMAMFAEPQTSILGEILPIIQHMGEQKKLRTGVAPELSVDPQVLQQATAGAFAQALDDASQRTEMLVRIFAETGIKQLMLKVHQLMRQHQDIEKAVKMRGEWISVDPEGWRDRTELTVNVGLGFNNKQVMVQLLFQLIVMQEKAMGQGLADHKRVFNALRKLIEAANLGDVNQYFLDPSKPGWKGPPEPPPDPNMIVAEANAKSLEADAQRKQQEMQGNLQINGMKTQGELQIKQQGVQIDGKRVELDMSKLRSDVRKWQEDFSLKQRNDASKRDNVDADTDLKRAQIGETNAEAGLKRVEGSETYQEAKRITEDSDGSEG